MVSIKRVLGVLGLCRTADVSDTGYLALAATTGAELKAASVGRAAERATNNELEHLLG